MFNNHFNDKLRIFVIPATGRVYEGQTATWFNCQEETPETICQ